MVYRWDILTDQSRDVLNNLRDFFVAQNKREEANMHEVILLDEVFWHRIPDIPLSQLYIRG